MTSTAARHRQQVNAVVALLRSLTDQQLRDVLAALEARGVVAVEQPENKPKRACGVCGLPYALCRQRWTGDHEFELTIK